MRGSLHHRRFAAPVLAGVLLAILLAGAAGCAKYNTFFNAKKMFDQAEKVREDAIRQHKDPPVPVGGQKSDYEASIRKAQKLIDEYPGHSLTDDALFLQAKAYHRLQSYRMSIRKFDLLFTNFPATPYMEEALYLQSLNYLMLDAVVRSQEYLDKLAKQYPESELHSRTMKVSGDNAYALEEWESAATHYRAYLDQFPDSKEWDRVGLKLGQCYWELKDYRAAADILQEVVEKTASTELGFQASLLRAKALVRSGQNDVASALLDRLREPAEIYQAEGQVLLAEVEILVARGDMGAAVPLLESMPEDWKTPEVKARAADRLARIRLDNDELEDAQTAFREAIAGKAFLDDEYETKRLNENLNDYLAAENALPDAQSSRVPRLKLLQANAMLFGFERPGEAVRLYREAAADTAADSTVAARCLYGAAKVYREYLSKPDSAEIYASLLQEKYPDSAQAYEMRSVGGGNLLAFLLERRDEEQQKRLEDLSDEELADLNEVKEFVGSGPGEGRPRVLPIRRRQVYLARRDNILYEPPPLALARIAERKPAASETVPQYPVLDPETGEQVVPDSEAEGAVAPGDGERAATGELIESAAPEEELAPVESDEQTDEEKDEEQKQEDEKKDRAKRRTWEFDLNAPVPGPDLQP